MFDTVSIDTWYLKTLDYVLNKGKGTPDRTNTGTLSVFGGSVRFDLREGFPLLSVKKTNWDWAFKEMLFFLNGHTNVKELHKQGVPIWDSWATSEGELGPIYGSQARRWPTKEIVDGEGNTVVRDTKDQFLEALNLLRWDPYSRRIIVEHWNPAYLPDPNYSPQFNVCLGRMSLAPCHKHYQLVVTPSQDVFSPILNLHLYQRSADFCLGVPFNIAQYAFLLSIIARYVGMIPGILQISYGDIHVYLNHVEPALKVLSKGRTVPESFPKLILDYKQTIAPQDVDMKDVAILDYYPDPFVPFPINV